jgi:glycosyltransferase involved in cell wall biosynthesis
LDFTPPPGIVAVFAGAFRTWHGAIHLARAIRQLRERGNHRISALFIGDGPELPAVRSEAAGLDGIVFTGALRHERMPAALAAAHIGVAPFDIGVHKPLSLGFYWSPLKMFEYMASGLPVVAPSVARIPRLIEHEREGLLYDPRDDGALAHALEQLTNDELRKRLGAGARERAVREYSWRAHCEALDRRLRA